MAEVAGKVIKITFNNPLKEGVIENIDMNFKTVVMINDEGKKVVEFYGVGTVELDDNNDPVMDSSITGQYICM